MPNNSHPKMYYETISILDVHQYAKNQNDQYVNTTDNAD